MFVPVACVRCGKPFQVPPAAAGTDVPCPWCNAVGLALPVVSPDLSRLTPAAQSAEPLPEPLSLDDEPPAPASPVARRPWRPVVGVGVLAAAVFALTFAALGYRSGRVPPTAWREVAAPDGSFRVELPAEPITEPIGPLADFPMARGGQRLAARGWYSGVIASVGWYDLDPERAKTMRADDLAGGVFAARRAELRATATSHANVRRADRDGFEYRYGTPAAPAADRVVVVGTGPRPRVYVLSYAAPRLGENDPGLVRFWESFRTE